MAAQRILRMNAGPFKSTYRKFLYTNLRVRFIADFQWIIRNNWENLQLTQIDENNWQQNGGCTAHHQRFHSKMSFDL